MSVTFDVVHTTQYRYKRPVVFGEHRAMFRPREGADLHLLSTAFEVAPLPIALRTIQDVYSNSVVVFTPESPARELKVVCRFTVVNTGVRVLELPVDEAAAQYPFTYSAEEDVALGPFLLSFYDDPGDKLLAWAKRFVPDDGRIGSRDLLVKMNAAIRDDFQYAGREEEGVQTPFETIDLGSGSCRDLATLMIEAVRRLGYAARFVSGYLYTPALDSAEGQNLGAGATHAWLQVYLPGAGWMAFDPTNNLVGGTDLIRVGYARHAAFAPPLAGSWTGAADDYEGMTVEVTVSRR